MSKITWPNRTDIKAAIGATYEWAAAIANEVKTSVNALYDEKLDKISTSDQSVASNVDFDKGVNVANKIGIGTTNPTSLLSLGDTSSVISTDSADGSDNKRISIAGGGAVSTARGAYGIFHGNEYATDAGAIWLNSGAIADSYIQLGAQGSPTKGIRIDFDGLVGIGTVTPQNKLDVAGGMVVGSGYAGISTAPTDGLLIEGRTSINTTSSPGMLNVNNEFGVSVPAIDIQGDNTTIKQTLIRPSGGAAASVVDLFGQTTGEAEHKWAEIGVFGSMVTSVATIQYIYFGVGEDVAFDDNTFRLYPNEIANFQGDVGIGPTNTSPSATLDIDQESLTGAKPTIKLTQADLSEEMIKFDATIGTGNPIEAIGAKSFTQTHFLKVYVEGVGIKHVPMGDLA